MELFAVCCTTCQARLKVRDQAAIGKILACPKCGSMVQVAPPPGWQPPPTEAITKIAAEPSSGSTLVNLKPVSPTKANPTKGVSSESAAAQASGTPAPATAALRGTPSAAKTELAVQSAPVTVAPTTISGPINPDDVPPLPTSPPGPSIPSRVLTRISEYRLVLLTAPIVLLVLALLAWIMFQSGEQPAEQLATAPHNQAVAESAEPPIAEASPHDAADMPAAPEAAADATAVAAESADATPGAPAREEPAVEMENVAGNRPAAAEPNLLDRVADQGAAPEGGDNPEGATADPQAAADAARNTPAGPGHLAKPIAPFGAPPEEQKPAVPAATEPANAAAEPVADPNDVIVGHESMPPVDVAARLDDPVPEVQFKRISLADYCDFLSRFSTIPITLDTDALALVNVRPSDQVSLSLEDTTVADALTEVLAKRGLMFLVDGQQLIVTSPDRKAAKPLSMTFDVADLAPTDADVGALAMMVGRFVSPASWQEIGGKGRVKAQNKTLIVEQDPITLRNVALFLEKLRQARGLAAKGDFKPDAVALKTKYSRIKANLDKSITANFSLETPLVDILAWLARSSGTRILVDEASLGQAGLWSHVPAKVLAEKQPLYDVLTALLSPMGMTYRIVDDKTLQVFARQSQNERLEFELYPLGDLIAARLDPQDIVERIRKQFDAASWVEGGGLGAMEVDPASKCLIVVQSPEAQIRLENLLLRARPNARPNP